MKEKKLFNAEALDDNIKIINGDTTNILNLANVKYQWAHNIYDEIYSNNWLPHKVSMGNDKSEFKKLTDPEQKGYKTLLSFLIYLDSIQTNNLPNISDYITAPDVVFVLARQIFDEANHSKSYGWILSSLFTQKEYQEIVYEWRDNPLLLERIQFITKIYQEAKDAPTDLTKLKSIVANYLLEGLYFYNGFQFFHNLASRGLMIGTDTQIRYIQRDETQHCSIFKNILLEIRKEYPEMFELYKQDIIDMFKEAAGWEKRFSLSTIGNSILGITESSITEYTEYLCNKRLKDINMDPIFDEVSNPYEHLEMIAGIDNEASNRTNNFESTSINYKNPDIIVGWDELRASKGI